MKGAMILGMMGQIQVMPMCYNDPMWTNEGRNEIEGLGGCR